MVALIPNEPHFGGVGTSPNGSHLNRKTDGLIPPSLLGVIEGYLVAEPPHYLSASVYTYVAYTYTRGLSLCLDFVSG